MGKVTLNHFPRALGTEQVKGPPDCLSGLSMQGPWWGICSQLTEGRAARSLSNVASSLLNSIKESTQRSMVGQLGEVLQAFLGLALVKRLLSQKNPSMASKMKDCYFIVFQNKQFYKIWVLFLA